MQDAFLVHVLQAQCGLQAECLLGLNCTLPGLA